MKRLGAWTEDGMVHVRTWAPGACRLTLCLEGRTLAMTREDEGLWFASFPDPGGEVRYRFSPDDGGPFPDPMSGAQPQGVHEASALDRREFAWTDGAWAGVTMDKLVICEVHVGAATEAGTFEALIPHLDHYARLGVTALELMPVGAFPGARNWGYDGVYWQAPSAVYGGPEGLRRLVDEAHARGLGIIVDVVLNHFGPDGNYLWVLGRDAFTDRFKTPWGEALDWGNPVVCEMAYSTVERLVRDFHVDGLRLDATHALCHEGTHPSFLKTVAERARAAAPHRRVVVIAEDDRNDARLVHPTFEGGDGLDAVWADDFHHAMRRLLAGDSDGYYADYEGTLDEVVRALKDGWIYMGEHSTYRNAPRGTRPLGLPPTRFVHCLQNHDQIGNRPAGDRLGFSIDRDALLAATAVLLFSPHVPLLFMGEEWNASTPFPYFTDHAPELGRQVTEGRRREFGSFRGFSGEVPDPQALDTFTRAKLDWTEPERPDKRLVLEWHRRLLAHRKLLRPGACEVRDAGEKALVVTRKLRTGGVSVLVAALSGQADASFDFDVRRVFSSTDPAFGGQASVRVDARRVRLGGAGAVVLESA